MPKIVDVIKYEGDNSTFVWKHPCEDFNTNTQLIVHESQEAIFFMNGLALDLFGSGRYTLETQNIPLVRNFINLPTDGVSAFHCEVYFVNKTEQMALRWGTDSKVQYVEPTYKFPLSIGASGEMSLAVDDSRKLLVKLVGTESSLDRQQLTSYFRGILMTKVKTYIAQTMRTNAINIFEVDEQLEKFSEDIHQKLIPDFLDYGVALNPTVICSMSDLRNCTSVSMQTLRRHGFISRQKLLQRRLPLKRLSLIRRHRLRSGSKKDIPISKSVDLMLRKTLLEMKVPASLPTWVSVLV